MMCRNKGWYLKNNPSGLVMTSDNSVVTIVMLKIKKIRSYTKQSAKSGIRTVYKMSEAAMGGKHC